MHGPVPEVERHRVRDLELVAGLGAVERGERARLAALGVVRAAGARLREELEEADEEDNLPLARLRDLVPEFGRRLGGVVTRDVDGQLDAVRVEAVADEAGHRDAAVLDLGVAQPADRVLVAAAPEVGVSEAERVVEANDGVQLDGERLKVGLGLLDLDRGAGGRRGDERRGDRKAGESDGELLRWGYGDELFLSCVDEHANWCVRDCKLVCIQSSDLRSSYGAAMEATHCTSSELGAPPPARMFPVDVANAEPSGVHAKCGWLFCTSANA
jgi:hypothetical protein